MKVKISWKTFQVKFLKGPGIVWVFEDEYSWKFWTNQDIVLVCTEVPKPENKGERVNFVDLYLTGMNIVKIEDYDEQISINMRMYQE